VLSTAYALPYALAQPFLGPLGDRFGKTRCIQICIAGLAAMLLLGAVAPTFEWLLASRVLAGIFFRRAGAAGARQLGRRHRLSRNDR
jgi:MFS family permease